MSVCNTRNVYACIYKSSCELNQLYHATLYVQFTLCIPWPNRFFFSFKWSQIPGLTNIININPYNLNKTETFTSLGSGTKLKFKKKDLFVRSLTPLLDFLETLRNHSDGVLPATVAGYLAFFSSSTTFTYLSCCIIPC